MPERKGSRPFVKKIPKFCENCPERKKTPCQDQVLPEYSEREFFTYRQWCRLSPQPCQKVKKYINQGYASQKETCYCPIPQDRNENPELELVQYHVSRRVIAEQDTYKSYYPSSTRTLIPREDDQHKKPYTDPREAENVGMRYRRPRMEKLPLGLQDQSLDYPFLSKLQNKIIHLFYFEGFQINEMAHRLSSPGQKITIQVVKREKEKALKKLKEYSSTYDIEYLKLSVKERELRPDLIKAIRLLNKKGSLTNQEAEWFRNFTSKLDEKEWRTLLWKKH